MNLKTIPWLLVGICLIVIFLQRECTGPRKACPPGENKTSITIIPGDSIPYPVEVPKPVPYKVEVPVYITQQVDTLTILKDYFATYHYNDTVTVDSSFKAIIIESISQNKIVNRKLFVQNLKPTAIITNTTTLPDVKRTRVLAGPLLGGNLKAFGVGGSLTLLTKKDNSFTYSFDALQQMHYISTQYKISFRKK